MPTARSISIHICIVAFFGPVTGGNELANKAMELRLVVVWRDRWIRSSTRAPTELSGRTEQVCCVEKALYTRPTVHLRCYDTAIILRSVCVRVPENSADAV